MSSKAAQLIGSSYKSSNRSVMTPSPNDDLGLGGGGSTKYTDTYDPSDTNLANLNQDFFKKSSFLPQNYPFYDNEPLMLKSTLFDMSSLKQHLGNNEQQNLVQQRCGNCGTEPMIDGKTLVGCFHSFCQTCLIQLTFNGVIQTEIKGPGYAIIICPICSQETLIPNDGLDSLTPNYSNSNFPGSANSSTASLEFNNLQFKPSYLPSTPSSASSSSSSSTTTNSSPQIANYAKSCPINLDQFNKSKNNFMLDSFSFDQIGSSLDQNILSKRQQNKLNEQLHLQQQSRLFQIESDIQKAFGFYAQLLNERRENLIKELHSIFQFVLKQNSGKMTSKSSSVKSVESIDESKKSDNEQQSDDSSDLQLLINNRLMSIEFVTNLQNVQDLINQSFGYIRYNNSNNSDNEPKSYETSNQSSFRQKSANSFYSDMHQEQYSGSSANFLIEQFVSNINNNQIMTNQQNNKQLSSSNGSSQSLTSKNHSQKQQSTSGSNNRATSWSSVVASSSSARTQSQNQTKTPFDQLDECARQSSLSSNNGLLSSTSTLSSSDQHVNLEIGPSSYEESSLSTSNPLPAKSQIKRLKMTYSCKFGEFGVTDGQFTEPSGVSIGPNNDIIVADTNSHRIQIFDNEGRFKFKFGECGKREGQLLYPNRVAVVKQTGDIVVTERSPTHQIQIYNQYGQFIRKFGANILQHPRGVCVDSKNRIIVVECKVMRVIIFDLMGTVLHKFNCAKYLEFPNGCCCSNDREEIFISDNRAHCIKVFNYEGQFLRQIGGEGITNYPIGVGINSNGEVLVADNHNNFNLTVFNQDGQMITALESKVKHAQCFDVGLMDDGSIVLASKDYRIYVYKYNSQSGSTSANESASLVNSSSIYSTTQASNNNNNIINSINAFNNF